MPTTLPPRQEEQARALAARNRRTAGWLVAWIAFLVLVSIAVIWVRN